MTLREALVDIIPLKPNNPLTSETSSLGLNSSSELRKEDFDIVPLLLEITALRPNRYTFVFSVRFVWSLGLLLKKLKLSEGSSSVCFLESFPTLFSLFT